MDMSKMSEESLNEIIEQAKEALKSKKEANVTEELEFEAVICNGYAYVSIRHNGEYIGTLHSNYQEPGKVKIEDPRYKVEYLQNYFKIIKKGGY